jgi:hypothetical protein
MVCDMAFCGAVGRRTKDEGHERRALNIYPLVARKVRENPGVIRTALATLDHWETLGVLPERRLKEWRTILRKARASRQGRKALIALLSSRSPKNRRLLDFAPFAGVLTREERRTVFLKCAYDH